MKSKMKTAEQWLEALQDVSTERDHKQWVEAIQNDALEYAAGLCIQHAHTGNPEGWTDSVSRDCANLINSKRVAVMSNAADSACLGHPGPSDNEDEQMLRECILIIKNEHVATVSLFQRRLRLGYTRAARIMDELEKRGIVGPSKGAEPRDIRIELS